jgi:hypothetical protein
VDVDQFEKVSAQLDGLYQELAILVKKSPNDAFKIKLINSTLLQANKLLGKRYKPFDDFEQFDIDTLPTNSDVAFIISQYMECAEKLRADNISSEFGEWYWRGKSPRIRTAPPKKLKKS